MALGSIDYIESYLKYKIATLIRREPINNCLKYLKLELQVNMSSVETNLGGGNHRYLRVILMDTEFALIPHIQPFVASTYLGSLNIPSTATPIEVLNLKD